MTTTEIQQQYNPCHQLPQIVFSEQGTIFDVIALIAFVREESHCGLTTRQLVAFVVYVLLSTVMFFFATGYSYAWWLVVPWRVLTRVYKWMFRKNNHETTDNDEEPSPVGILSAFWNMHLLAIEWGQFVATYMSLQQFMVMTWCVLVTGERAGVVDHMIFSVVVASLFLQSLSSTIFVVIFVAVLIVVNIFLPDMEEIATMRSMENNASSAATENSTTDEWTRMEL